MSGTANGDGDSGGGNQRSREVRIGLVMYGGVSLAIYMNGVAAELFRAVRGRGVYRLFKTMTDSDVTVDVVSGASAGGINGMFLAYALCNDVEFSTCAELWRKHGDIAKLLRNADAPPEAQISLLDSEGFYEPHLAGAFRDMWEADLLTDGEAVSPVRELDLFVAATDFNGRLSRAVDAAGHVIDVKDHRAVFWLKHRNVRKCQLDPEADAQGHRAQNGDGVADTDPARLRDRRNTGYAAFAKLARITSCFPAAFAPVAVEVPAGAAPPATSSGGGEPTEAAVGRKLGVWGALDPGEYHFLDGGILDNKPFSSTLKTIFYRMADRPVQRHLLYVEPDPERFQRTAPTAPTFLSSALDSLTRLPSYESIAGDLKAIAEHNDATERFTRTWREVRRRVMSAPAGGLGDAVTVAAAGEAVAADLGAADQGEALYARARLQALGEMVISAVLNADDGPDSAAAGGGAGPQAGMTRERMTGLRATFDGHLYEASRDDARDLFRRFDVEFRLRRLLHLTYVLDEEDAERPTEGRLATATRHALLSAIGRRVELLEIIRAYMLRTLSHASGAWAAGGAADLWGQILARLATLVDGGGLADPVREAAAGRAGVTAPVLETLRKLLAARAAAPAGAGAGGSPPAADGLLDLTDLGERTLLAQLAGGADGARVRREYERYKDVDRVLFPMQFMSDLNERDIIRTVRVSPLDAQRGLSRSDSVADKVCGDALGHFGAFLKRSWRSNDLLYGRLDGACQVLETLLNVEWLRRTLGTGGQRRAALARMGIADAATAGDRAARVRAVRQWLEREAIFPGAGEGAVARAAAAVATVLDPDDAADVVAGREEALDALAAATHLDILTSDYGNLIEDAVAERLEWRQGAVASDAQPEGDPSAPPRFDPATRAFDVSLDDAVLAAAARNVASGALAGSASPEARAALLRNNPVGAETVTRDIPRLVLLEIVAHAMLVVRNCVINSLGSERAAEIRGSRIYRVFVDWPLRAFYALTRRLRRAPRRVGAFVFAALGYAGLAVAANVLLDAPEGTQPPWRRNTIELLFGVMPVVTVAAALLALWASGRPRGAPRAVLERVGGLLLRLIPLGALGALAYLLNGRATTLLCERVGQDAGGTCGAVARTAWLLGAALVGGAVGGWLRRPQAEARRQLEKRLVKSDFSDAELAVLEQRVLSGSNLRIPVDPSKVVMVSGESGKKLLKQRQARLLKMAARSDRMDRLEREMRVLRPGS